MGNLTKGLLVKKICEGDDDDYDGDKDSDGYDDESCDGDDDMNGTSSNFCRLLKLVAASVSKLD